MASKISNPGTQISEALRGLPPMAFLASFLLFAACQALFSGAFDRLKAHFRVR